MRRTVLQSDKNRSARKSIRCTRRSALRRDANIGWPKKTVDVPRGRTTCKTIEYGGLCTPTPYGPSPPRSNQVSYAEHRPNNCVDDGGSKAHRGADGRPVHEVILPDQLRDPATDAPHADRGNKAWHPGRGGATTANRNPATTTPAGRPWADPDAATRRFSSGPASGQQLGPGVRREPARCRSRSPVGGAAGWRMERQLAELGGGGS